MVLSIPREIIWVPLFLSHMWTAANALSSSYRRDYLASSEITNELDRSNLQNYAIPVASSFELSEDFDPGLLANPHVQTIGGFLLRDYAAYVPTSEKSQLHDVTTAASYLLSAVLSPNDTDDSFFWDEREKVETPDGDWFHADTKYSSKTASSTTPIVIILHGLESNSESGVTTEMARAITAAGMHCVCLNFRGCSGEPNDTLRFYHLGFTDDVKHYLNLMKDRNPEAPLYLSGFSLGANAALRCLGELGEEAFSEYNVAGGAVLCAPLDQERNTPVLERPGNKELYSDFLLKGLKERAVITLERFCDGDVDTDKFDFRRAMAAKTIPEFDDAFTAKIYGFDGVWDYYRQTSSIHYLDHIAVPTLILNGKDDPFFDPSVWPTEKSCDNGGSSPVKLLRSNFGGHLGFSFHRVPPEDERLMRGADQPVAPAPSWAAVELARFFTHVESHSQTQQIRKTRDRVSFYRKTSIARFTNFRETR